MVFGVFGLCWCFLFFSPPSVCFFPPFNDDLGTMPTRRPYSWKKKQDDMLAAEDDARSMRGPPRRKQGRKTIPSWWWESATRKCCMTATPACQTRSGRREHIPVAPLTLLWDKQCHSISPAIDCGLKSNVEEAKHLQQTRVGPRFSCKWI